FLKRGTSDRVILISDGAFKGAEDFARPAAHFSFINVGGGTDNVGIVAFQVRHTPGGSSQYEVMVHVRNYTSKAVRVPLTLALGEKTLARDLIDVEPNGRQILIYPLEGSLNGILAARLEIDDDFATDNQAFSALSGTSLVRLLYVGPGNPFLSNLLR